MNILSNVHTKREKNYGSVIKAEHPLCLNFKITRAELKINFTRGLKPPRKINFQLSARDLNRDIGDIKH